MNTKILNLTLHDATEEQRAQGVFEAAGSGYIKDNLIFNEPPSKKNIRKRADELAAFAKFNGADAAMIGGAPYLMSTLEAALKQRGIAPCYAFSQRESVEIKNADGSVSKQNIFKHLGFVWV